MTNFPLSTAFRLLFLLPPSWVISQVDSTIQDQGIPVVPEQIVEDYLQGTTSEGVFDFNTLFERFDEYRDNPLNLNEAEEEDLRALGLLSDRQILDLINYRREAGALISIYELQAVPTLDLPTIRSMVPYVTVDKGIDDFQVPLGRMLIRGKNELFLRWSRVLEEQKGYRPLEEGETGSRYLGDANRYYVRFRHTYSNKLSFGITAEKDPGEEFFTGSNKKGFDFYSAHFFLKDYSRTLKALAVGDYAISFGQGLILFSGFNYGKSSQVIRIKRSARTLRGYSSVQESQFLRGAAVTLGLGKNFEATGFVSYTGRDGNIAGLDTADIDAEIRSLTSFDTDGLHRTPAEIADRNAVTQLVVGGTLKYRGPHWHVSLNALRDQYDKPLLRTPQPYNRFYFNGAQLLNMSVDYSYIYENFNFFGETAMSDNGAVATLNGLLIGLDRKVDLSVLHRYYARDYWSITAQPFGETSGAHNEAGLYMGLEIRPMPFWKFSAYFDTWQHPWLRFNADAPSKGHEYRIRLTFYKKRRYELYVELRNEVKDENVPDPESKLNSVIPNRLLQARLYISNMLTAALEFRTRIDFGSFDNDLIEPKKGLALYQDIIYRPIGFPFSFTTRFSVYDTDGFDVRYYAYENNLINTFAIPAYYNRGTRFYFNLRYKGIRSLTLEARYAQTFWSDQPTVGSGLEETGKQTRTLVSAQLKYQF